MKKALFPILFLVVSVFASCEKTEEVELIDLTVTVKNSSGNNVSGADVEMFDTISKETVQEKTSDNSGKANFKLPGAKLYSVLAIKGSLAGSVKITNIMYVGESYTIDVTIK
jgi:hypothetical protein